jgi:hypothetical protein
MSRTTDVRSALLAALPDDLNAEVATGPSEAAKTFGGALGPARMLLRVYVGPPGEEAAQRKLDDLLDPAEDGSISDLLYTDSTLGGLIKNLQILSTSGWRIYETKDGPVLGAEFSIAITDPPPGRR